ncbi:dnaJ homolog subfamily C member 17 [Culicoides brevitarsis]|uniref:dnaJ homolog subfamily C member 17 n=1 Tax=Culicoides brevitarsis TaxID=469753 RepID=UPI00307C033D
MVDVKKFSEIDIYGLLEVEISATEQEIRKAYRKKALSCHPDKNPDNPKAAELFQELSRVLEILLDKTARAAYDRMLNAKKAAELRNKQLDSKRQKLKSELEERERQAQSNLLKKGNYHTETKTPEEIFKEEFDRLRKEGSRLVEEEQELMRQQLRQEILKAEKTPSWDSSKHRIKIKWKAAKDDPTNGGYSEEILRKFLQKYGELVVLVMSPKKYGSALVEFKTKEASEMAVQYERGNMNNPLTLEWIGEAPQSKQKSRAPVGSATVTDADYESLVLRQLRQAEERKRLIEQMMKEEAEGS